MLQVYTKADVLHFFKHAYKANSCSAWAMPDHMSVFGEVALCSKEYGLCVTMPMMPMLLTPSSLSVCCDCYCCMVCNKFRPCCLCKRIPQPFTGQQQPRYLQRHSFLCCLCLALSKCIAVHARPDRFALGLLICQGVDVVRNVHRCTHSI